MRASALSKLQVGDLVTVIGLPVAGIGIVVEIDEHTESDLSELFGIDSGERVSHALVYWASGKRSWTQTYVLTRLNDLPDDI